MEVRKVRDLTLVDLDGTNTLVIACDSCGSVGLKEKDYLKIPPFYAGKYTARVALMEVMCTGARVVTLTDAVCCEMDPTGSEIIEGIKEELAAAGIDQIVLTGSTEENFPTYSTGLGITVIGVKESSKLKINNVEKSCAVVTVGVPKVGAEVNLDNDPDLASYSDIERLLGDSEVFEIVPVGSKGILYEANKLAECNGRTFKADEGAERIIDMKKSCGPSTVIIAAVEEKRAVKLAEESGRIALIGSIH
jgi:hypothetical protein